MIDCPICHVMNEDLARFCAECGQRLTRTGPLPAPSGPAQGQGAPPGARPMTPAEPEPPKRPAAKLHSPILDSGGGPPAGPDYDSPRSDISRLRGAQSRGQSEAGPAPGPGRKLHSPLLGDSEPEPAPEQSAGRPGRKLHSPLLGGEEDAGYDASAPSRPAARGGLRSPLLGGVDDQYDDMPPPRNPLGGGHLRSPLLGGADPDYDLPQRPIQGGGARRPGGLHSPMLGGAEPAYEPEYDSQPEDDPNVLRSPLLAAKVPLADRPAPGARRGPEPPQPQPYRPGPEVRVNMSGLADNSGPAASTTPASSFQPGETMRGPGGQSGVTGPAGAAPAPGGFGSGPAGQPAQPAYPESPAGNRPPVFSPSHASESFRPATPPPAPAQAAPPPAAPPPSPASPPAFEAASLDSIPTPGRMSNLRGVSSPSPEEAEPAPRKRVGSRMLASDEPESDRSYQAPERFAGPAQPGGGLGALGRLLILPLCLAIAMTGYGLMQFMQGPHGQMFYMLGQGGQIIIAICLIMVCAKAR